MNKLQTTIFVAIVFGVSLFLTPSFAADPVDGVAKGERCSVCGMFVAKYSNWITQIHHKSGAVKSFDGVKDMMVYYFKPAAYGAKADDSITDVWVKDYYSLSWLDGKKAFYVIGSDVKGPMGEEFIPFSSKGAAETFMKDHHGRQIITFEEITSAQVESMRHGQMMQMKKMK